MTLGVIYISFHRQIKFRREGSPLVEVNQAIKAWSDIDIDIFKNYLIDIDIFKNDLIDIDIDIDIFQKCRYIDNRYFLSI